MEISIGVKFSTREINLESNETPDAVYGKVEEALANDHPLRLEDTKDREVIVPASTIAYVEVSNAKQHRVGFGL